jgi:ABC-2 type transport system permease protein
MNKILLILKREYLTRVKKKSFIIMTFLGPLLMAALMIVPVVLSMKQTGSSASLNKAIICSFIMYLNRSTASNKK